MSLTYVWAILFLVVYCARPEDWIPGATGIPFAKVTGILALVSAALSVGLGGRAVLHLPREIFYLLLLFGQLCLAVPFSPVWRGGAADIVFNQFSKVVMMAIVIAMAATTQKRLRRFMFVQAASVAAVVVAALWKNQRIDGTFGRLSGVLGGIYDNPNDLAFAIALAFPFCFMFLLAARNIFKKSAWALVLVAMTYAVLCTYSRGGLVALVTALGMCIWEFALKQRRHHLAALTVFMALGVLLMGGPTRYGERLATIFSPETDATGSAQARRELLRRSLVVTADHPLFGVGPGNFQVISGNWHETHNTYTQLSAEAGIPALILFLLIVRRSFLNLRATKLRSRDDQTLLQLAGTMRASLLGFVIGSAFGSAAYHFFPYFLIGYTSALARIARAREAPQLQTPGANFTESMDGQEQKPIVATTA